VPTNVPEDRSVGSKMISPYHTHDYQPNARCESHRALWCLVAILQKMSHLEPDTRASLSVDGAHTEP
jgi:hypothetical protein